jgi:large subunit ribosomal protein L13
MKKQKSFGATNETSNRRWVLVDVDDKVLGRAASKIADLLRGKHLPQYTPNIDTGDFVVVVNSKKIKLTGNKWSDKIVYHHTGFPGGLKERSAQEVMDKHPDELLRNAVWGMLPKNKLSRQLMTKLKIYAEAEHPHHSQQPEVVVL